MESPNTLPFGKHMGKTMSKLKIQISLIAIGFLSKVRREGT